jgi:hypothetical protein
MELKTCFRAETTDIKTCMSTEEGKNLLVTTALGNKFTH